MGNTPGREPVYAFGHAPDELQRLINQARFFGDLTEQLFHKAGLAAGMRVLDLGCGAGDVSFLAAKFVGPTGAVVGVDRSADSLAVARERAAAAGLRNVSFVEGDVADPPAGPPFDAAVGRLVLMYLPDPAAALRRVAGRLRPGGLIAVQEMDIPGARCLPESPLYRQCTGWLVEALRRSGAETQMGLKLRPVFVAAGLPPPEMILGARVEGGPDSPAYAVVAQTVRSLLPMIERSGVAKAEEVGIETLEQRLRDEVTAGGGVIVAPPLVGAWARAPA